MIYLIAIFCSFSHPNCRHEIPMPDMRTCVEEARMARAAGAHEAYCIRR